ncbi:MAG TPA: M35 family metallo-endopeptidase [Burkholderiaceae bacterium]
MDLNLHFKRQYDISRERLACVSDFDPSWYDLIEQLYELMSTVGFVADRALSLDELRRRTCDGGTSPKARRAISDSEGLMRAVGRTEAAGAPLDAMTKLRLGALKMLRHVYLLNKSGNRQVWIHSLPVDFQHWAVYHLHQNCGTDQAVRKALDARAEQFTRKQKKELAVATSQAMAWCHRALIVLGQAASNGARAAKSPQKRDDARALVRRWFADPSVTEATLDIFIDCLGRGFKLILAKLNRGHFVLTDWVPIRQASTKAEQVALNSTAFTFAKGKSSDLDVVYIESAFFNPPAGNVIQGQRNWTRVMVHELAHLACGAVDVNLGGKRYAWFGIGPHAGYPGMSAIKNADNWAFFAADCAEALTAAERQRALKII